MLIWGRELGDEAWLSSLFELVRGDTGGTDRTIPHSKITTLHYWCRKRERGRWDLQWKTALNYNRQRVKTTTCAAPRHLAYFERVWPLSQVCLATNDCTYLLVVPVCHWMRSTVESGSKTSSFCTSNRTIWDSLTSVLADSKTREVEEGNVRSVVLSEHSFCSIVYNACLCVYV
jgi:hypothetical protein